MWRVSLAIIGAGVVAALLMGKSPEVPPLPLQEERFSPPAAYYKAMHYSRRAFRQSGLPFEAVSLAANPSVATAVSLGKYREIQRMTRTVTENLGACEPCCGGALTCEALREIDSLTLEIESSTYFGGASVTLSQLSPLPPGTPGAEIVSFEGSAAISSHADVCGNSEFTVTVTVQCNSENNGLTVLTLISSGPGDVQADFFSSGGELGSLPVYLETPLTVGDALFICPDIVGCADGGDICGSTIQATLME